MRFPSAIRLDARSAWLVLVACLSVSMVVAAMAALNTALPDIAIDTGADAAIVTLAKSLAGRNDHAKVAFGTEAGLFVSMAGVPSVVIGPGSIAQAHTPDEFVEMAELEKCADFVAKLIAHCAAS